MVITLLLIPLALTLPALSPPRYGRTPALPRLSVTLPRLAATRHSLLLSAKTAQPEEEPLPRAKLMPIWLFIFVQSLGVGVTISTLPLHLLSLGASTVGAARVVSGFSAMQMVFAPLLVKLSHRLGRSPVLLLCMCGSVASNALTALSSSYNGVVAARLLAGAFAANLALAQAASTDLVTREQSTRALGLVSAAMTLGISLGPAFASAATGAFAAAGVPAALRARGIFAINAALGAVALSVGLILGLGKRTPPAKLAGGEAASVASVALETSAAPAAGGVGLKTQIWLRCLSFTVGWAITLSVSTYSIFASRRLGFGQKQIGLAYSGAAAAALVTNLFALPRLVRRYGESRTCSLGLLVLGSCAAGTGLVLTAPWHAACFVLRGAAVSLTDTTLAALIAKYSQPGDKATNLGLASSVQAAARLICPLVSAELLDSAFAGGRFGQPGANSLPFVALGVVAALAAAVPLLALPRLEGQGRRPRAAGDHESRKAD